MPLVRIALAIFIVIVSAIGFAVGRLTYTAPEPEVVVTHGYGILSRGDCNWLYGVIVIWSDGSHQWFDYHNPLPKDIDELLSSDGTLRTGIAVPCPPSLVPEQRPVTQL